jgi:hypothetical protein
MDGLALLQEARAAGLTVQADGERLRVRGPRGAESLAQQILVHKADVLSALAAKRPLSAESTGADEAERLVASCFPAWDNPARNPLLSPLADAVDRAFLARDLERLRQAVAAFQELAVGTLEQ